MQSLAEQNDEQLGGPLSVLVRQKRDHVALDALLVDYVARRAPTGAAPTLHATSQTLAAAAGRVERLEPMRRGERASTSVPTDS